MEKKSALYQLIGIHMNIVMNGITNSDEDHLAIIQKSDEYSGKPDAAELPKEVRLSIDRYISNKMCSAPGICK